MTTRSQRRSALQGPRPDTRIQISMLAALAGGLLAAQVHAQCVPHWQATGGIAGSAGANVSAITTWDPDGPGPAPSMIVVAGDFSAIEGTPASSIAAWDGKHWTTLGGGVNGVVDALAVLPDHRLIVAGAFSSAGSAGVAANNIAVWDGTNWSPLGSGVDNEVWALAVGARGQLYAGGSFSYAGGAISNHVAVWESGAWSKLGAGSVNGVGGVVYGLAIGAGGDLYVGGGFTTAGGVANRRYIAKWSDASRTWSSVGAGMNWTVLCLAAMENGDIVAGGTFTFCGTGPASRIARWDGLNWSPLGAGTNAQPLVLLPLGDGRLVAGGHFVFAGGAAVSKVAIWDGTTWSPMGSGMDNYVIGMTQLPSGEILAGGGFTTADGVASPGLARWTWAQPPSITTNPLTQQACVGETVVFSVAATGSGPLSYQWRLDGANLADTESRILGSTTDRLTLIGVTAQDAGMYECLVSNACDSALSATADFSVRDAADPACCPCRADYDGSGGTPDASDINAFFTGWLAGDLEADADCSGGTPDASDIDRFFLEWLYGGC